VLEAPEAVEDQRLGGAVAGSTTLVEEQAVASQPITQSADGGVGDGLGTRQLSEGRAAEEAVEDVLEKILASKPVGDGEGL
jgi:hypothetical protein